MPLLTTAGPACALCWSDLPDDDSHHSWELEDGQIIIICARCNTALMTVTPA